MKSKPFRVSLTMEKKVIFLNLKINKKIDAQVFLIFFLVCFFLNHASAQPVKSLNKVSSEQYRKEKEKLQEQRGNLKKKNGFVFSSTDAGSEDEKEAFPGKESPCFKIDSVSLKVIGERQGEWGWLYKEIEKSEDESKLVGSCIGTKGISLIMSRLQNALIEKGWTTTRIVAPPQDLSAGELIIEVIEGEISDILHDGEKKARTKFFNSIPTKPGRLFNLRDIEQGLENFRRIPTVEADFSIKPSGEPGKSDLVIRHKQGFPLRMLATIDDSGSKSTGKYQGSFTISYDNPLGVSDMFYVTIQNELAGKNYGERGNSGYSTHYSIPWGYSLFSMDYSNSKYHQTVAGAFQDYLYSGEFEKYEAEISRVLSRDHVGVTTLSMLGFHRRSQNYIDDTEVVVQRRAVSGAELELAHHRSVGSGKLEASITYRRGFDALGALPAPEEDFGDGTSKMRVWLLNVSIKTPINFKGNKLSYYGSLSGQFNETPLTHKDKISIGGRYSVRGFDGKNVLSGDRGMSMRNELSVSLGNSPYSFYSGVDWGRVGRSFSRGQSGSSLVGAFVGLRSKWNIGSFKTSFDVFLGQPIHKPEKLKTEDKNYGFRFSINY